LGCLGATGSRAPLSLEDVMDAGDKVKVKPVHSDEFGLTFQGGEGVVEQVGSDTKGAVVYVRMVRSGKVRAVRPDCLVVHRKKEK